MATILNTRSKEFILLPFTASGTRLQLGEADIPKDEVCFFQLLFTDEFVTNVAEHTNEYTRAKLAIMQMRPPSI